MVRLGTRHQGAHEPEVHDQHQVRVRTPVRQRLDSGPRTNSDLTPAFRPSRTHVRVLRLEGNQGVRILRLDLVAPEPRPAADIELPQAGDGACLDAESSRYELGCLDCPPEVAAEESQRPVPGHASSHGFGSCRGRGTPGVRERRISVALPAPGRVPLGLSVPQQPDLQPARPGTAAVIAAAHGTLIKAFCTTSSASGQPENR